MISSVDVDGLLEDEWYVVRYSGETPEIAYCSALFQLTKAPDGPKLTLTCEQMGTLRDAAYARSREIVLRDIDIKNVGSSGYRGLARTVYNYARHLKFCLRQGAVNELDDELCCRLAVFLGTEIYEIDEKFYESIFNCSVQEFENFLESLPAKCLELKELVEKLAPYFPK